MFKKSAILGLTGFWELSVKVNFVSIRCLKNFKSFQLRYMK